MISRSQIKPGMWMVNILTCLLVLASLSPLFFITQTQGHPAASTHPDPFSPDQVLIIGDSITALPLHNKNKGNKGWWQYLLDSRSGNFNFSAESGSGYTVAGHGNSGSSFYARLDSIAKTKPKAIIIAGGFNDRRQSNPSPGIKKFYDKLSHLLKQNKIPASNVYVFVPRPKGAVANIVSIVRSNARAVGANYIEFDGYRSTYDSIHPTSSSAKAIEKALLSKSDFGSRLK